MNVYFSTTINNALLIWTHLINNKSEEKELKWKYMYFGGYDEYIKQNNNG